MIRAKNYQNIPKFVKVMHRNPVLFFSGHDIQVKFFYTKTNKTVFIQSNVNTEQCHREVTELTKVPDSALQSAHQLHNCIVQLSGSFTDSATAFEAEKKTLGEKCKMPNLHYVCVDTYSLEICFMATAEY